MKLIIDNGHGKETPGKRSPVFPFGQLMEWEWSRQVAGIIKNKAEKFGIETILLTPENSDVILSERARRANKILAADSETIGISIHANASTNGKAHGWEIWSDSREDESDVLGTFIFEAAQKMLPFTFRKNNPNDFVKDKDFTILYLTKGVFVLSENGFMDNEQDCKFMLSETGKALIAEAHILGILNYIKIAYGR